MKQMIEKEIKVILFRDAPDQKDTASYNRNMAIEKMVASTFNCELVSPDRPHGTQKKSRILYGLFKRVNLGLLLLNVLLKTEVKKYHYILFLRTIDPFMGIISWLFAKPKGIKLALERNEFPFAFISERTNSLTKAFYKYFVLPWHYRLFDVLFLMTDELIGFYGRHARKNCIVQKLPMTVDFSRFDREDLPHMSPYIFYAGSLSERKDGVESLIKAFKRISELFSDIHLKIAGGTKNGKQKKRLKNLIREQGLEEHADLLGLIDRDDIPGYLRSAKIVVLPRPNSLQARGGFPTKLGEYLASGKPVIVTRIGEIPKYLREDEVFFISPRNIVDDLVEKTKYIVSHYENALKVAERGRSAAKKYFSLEENQCAIKNAFEAVFHH